MQLVLVKPPRRVFPRVLDIDAHVVGAFNLDPLDSEIIVSSIDPDHPLRSGRLRRLGGGNLD